MTRRLSLILLMIPLFLGATWQREVLDWGMIGGMGTGGLLLSKVEPFFANPLINGAGDKECRTEQISDSWMSVTMLGTAALASLLPNQDGWLNERSYRHLKGSLGAITSGLLIKEFTKDLVGRPRPDYYDRIEQGYKPEEARKSFPSGHATHAFTAATYLALYTWDEWRGDAAWEIAVKSGITLLLAAGAGYVAYTRIADNCHYPGDVIVGSVLGAGTSLFFYSYQQWWGKPDVTFGAMDNVGEASYTPSLSVTLFRLTF